MRGFKGLLTGAAVLVFAGGMSCATVDRTVDRFGDEKEMPVQFSEAIPAAKGEVEYERKGNQTEIEIEVEYLAPASEAVPGANAYVVWLRPRGDASTVVKLGVLDVGEDREGELEATSPYEEFDVFITAESDEGVTEPSGERIMTAQTPRTVM